MNFITPLQLVTRSDICIVYVLHNGQHYVYGVFLFENLFVHEKKLTISHSKARIRVERLKIVVKLYVAYACNGMKKRGRIL